MNNKMDKFVLDILQRKQNEYYFNFEKMEICQNVEKVDYTHKEKLENWVNVLYLRNLCIEINNIYHNLLDNIEIVEDYTIHYKIVEETIYFKLEINEVRDLYKKFRSIQNSSYKLFVKKNTDYGDSFKEYGTIGIIVRIGDKIKRMMTITKNSISLVNEESLNDTLLDLHNYATMAVLTSEK